MTRPALWLIPATFLLLAGCSGPNGDKLGAMLGDGSATLGRELSREQLATIPTLNNVNLDAPLTQADYDLFMDHMQAFFVNVVGTGWLQADPDKLNTLVNDYRPNIGQIVADLQSGSQTPEDVCRYAAASRQAIWQELDANILTGDSGEQIRHFWARNTEFWNAAGYPAGPPDVGAEAVREIGITGEQAARLIEIGVKTMIRSGRVMNPEGTVYAGTAGDPFRGESYSDRDFAVIGNQAWNDMMNVFTSEQRRKAFAWWKSFDARMEPHMKQRHQPTPPQFDHAPAPETAG